MFDTFVDFIKNKGTIDIINYKPWLYVAKIDKTNNIIINQLKEIGLLIGIGAFVSGQVIRFRPKTIGGIIGAVIGILSFTLQGDLWTWQMLTLSLASVAALVIPGFLYFQQR